MSEVVDPWDGDAPVFDPKCPKCGRFLKSEVHMTVNGFGEIIEARAACSKCGSVTPSMSHWKSDETFPAPSTPDTSEGTER